MVKADRTVRIIVVLILALTIAMSSISVSTLYANDSYGNWGSKIVTFTVDFSSTFLGIEPISMPTLVVIVATIAALILMILYRRHRIIGK